MSSAPHERYIAITVKEERYISGTTKYPPLLSPLLVRRTSRGTRMIITGFTGPYTLNTKILAKTDYLFHICGAQAGFRTLRSSRVHYSCTLNYGTRCCIRIGRGTTSFSKARSKGCRDSIRIG